MTKTKPSHKIYAVRKSGERNFRMEIGAAYPTATATVSLKLELMPIGSDAEIVLRKPKPAILV